ncbi:urea ABC transporter permease subunit UrtB [Aurantimonas sp. C2-5-R2]|uniref:urea ABC transporter permease subunit UrtB n=1 Tax=unclassified Aurantimonas TaxID=2638230 RepID=UPI002E180021|nr:MULTISPECIES: urea ABC transporter permease subunit UrtB [unclassified Aurantimonas]MEC5288951.1 urea ABC transporter permease subunit UrtB [Aurantimonas sp. C2-3-R2]MEC5410227.1 urea ABC transporter permease subunit UrtB [Aurantimonas sp. C2-4-R8]
MNDLLRWCLVGLLAFGGALLPVAALAQDGDPAVIIQKFGGKQSFDDTEAVIAELAATGEPEVARTLRALSAGDLYWRESDEAVFIVTGKGNAVTLRDPLTGKEAGTAPSGDLTKVRIKNSIRNAITGALGSLTLRAADPNVRLRAASTLFSDADPDMLEPIEAALAEETDPAVKARMEEARASAILASHRPAAAKAEAAAILEARGDRESLTMLTRFAAATADPAARQAAEAAVAGIESNIAFWNQMQNIWYGLSLGSVLLLAAIGLAITFGVMGVINMAHGEMVMLGAYTTFVVQEVIRVDAPWLFPWSLAIALPLAFLVSGFVGLVMERGIIRFLYGRPLETLLATFGVSLMLQQAVRTIFGPSNRQVGNPDWMSGAFDIGLMSVTWNRLWIIVFSLVVFAGLLLVLNRTALGLQMRAVTQNRKMASAMGIRTPWVDAMTFALGSGVAGIAGVALSQIDNVSPSLGQGYIIDSFMVVVFGGVGNLWGTLVGAMSLGILNKFLEPYAGAVLGKIVVLVLIILFIQKRPRGLFAQKGRFVDA